MKLRRDSWLVWWAFIGEDYVPRHVSLCQLFWRCVLLTAGKGVLMTALFPIFCVYVGVEWIVKKARRLSPFRRHDDTGESMASEIWYGIKERVCPMVEIERNAD